MEDTLLLISSHEDVIAEFLEAYKGESFKIEVARNGVEAVRMIAAKTYKVVITNMLLKDIDGSKIVAFLKKTSPRTVCIVYTTKLSIGQVAFLINKAHVFKIFLRPADYKGEMLDAIEEGFTRFGVFEADKEDLETSIKREEEERIRLVELKSNTMNRMEAVNLVRNFAEVILDTTAAINTALNETDRMKLLHLEKKVMITSLQESEKNIDSLMALEVIIKGHFFENVPDKNFNMLVESNLVRLPAHFVLKLYMCIWFLIEYINTISKKYEMNVGIQFETSTRLSVNMEVVLPEDTFIEDGIAPYDEAVRLMYEKLIADNCTMFDRMHTPHHVMYQLTLESNEEAVFG
ncbi:MAG: response regulator [Lachnospiraceae bacterium]|nr:response regulator [Lachnospiraceae bacterium]